MPPKVKIIKQDIVAAALALVRERGVGALNAREFAARLSCSTQPIFCNFASMDELREATMMAAWEAYFKKLKGDLDSQRYPAYKASGMSYIDFAIQEPHLFEWLFMRDRTDEPQKVFEGFEEIISMVMQKNGLSRERAEQFHFSMWIYVHGIATSVASGYIKYDEEIISACITDVYFGLSARYREKEGIKNEQQY